MTTSSAECSANKNTTSEGNAHGPDVTFFGPDKSKLFNGMSSACNDSFRTWQSRSFRRMIRFAESHRKGAPLSEGAAPKRSGSSRLTTREAFVYSANGRMILDENGVFQSSLIPGFSIRLGDLFDQL